MANDFKSLKEKDVWPSNSDLTKWFNKCDQLSKLMARLNMEKVKIYNLQCSPCEALKVGILVK